MLTFAFLQKSVIEMNGCYINRLSDDLLFMIFKLADEEDQATFHDYLQQKYGYVVHWDEWRGYPYYSTWRHERDTNGFSSWTLVSAVGVCRHWQSLLSQIPSMWTVLQI